jgi:prepilin-type N-terminal cleavage/methylation domain-containing protein
VLSVSPYNSVKSGFSLIEMLIALAIFSVVIFPVMTIPMKAADQSRLLQDNTKVSYELGGFFDKLRQEVNASYRFITVPVETASGNTTPITDYKNRTVFMAYWDQASGTEKRVGYMFKAVDTNQWQLYKAYIDAGDEITTYRADNTEVWKSVAQLVSDTDFYMVGPSNAAPYFLYCQGSTCNTSINPEVADGVRVQSGTSAGSPTGMTFYYKDREVSSVDAVYFKLGSTNPTITRSLADSQVVPFATAIKQWTSSGSWFQQKTVSSVKYPHDGSGSADMSSDMPFNDFYYNHKSGDLLAVTNTQTDAGTTTAGGLYIMKLRPGYPDYKPYQLRYSSGNTYIENFPVSIHKDEPGWLYNGKFLSVTQDDEGYIYVLAYGRRIDAADSDSADGSATSLAYWVERFSPQGDFVSRFKLGSAVNTAYGITYNPGQPDDIQILVKEAGSYSADLPYKIYSYPKTQNEYLAKGVVLKTRSLKLNTAAVTSLLDSGVPTGIEYDPVHHRYLIAIQASNTDAQILSLDADASATTANTNDATLADRASSVSIIFYASNSSPYHLQYPDGIAYDPYSNMVFLSTENGGTYNYYAVIPSVKLNQTYGS